LQGTDGRIIFAIPYETDFTLIGTTDQEHPDAVGEAGVHARGTATICCAFANRVLQAPGDRDDIVWTYSGVRPLYDDGAKSATAATRDYVLKVDDGGGAPILNVFGGKITTYRRLAESALEKLAPWFPDLPPGRRASRCPAAISRSTASSALVARTGAAYPFLDDFHARGWCAPTAPKAFELLGEAQRPGDLGRSFGATLTEARGRLADGQGIRPHRRRYRLAAQQARPAHDRADIAAIGITNQRETVVSGTARPASRSTTPSSGRTGAPPTLRRCGEAGHEPMVTERTGPAARPLFLGHQDRLAARQRRRRAGAPRRASSPSAPSTPS
jgi:glycerol-3-phosphate dehydrogenase